MTENGMLAGIGVLVTGGGGGLGRAAARRLAADGAVVTLMGRTEQTLERAAASIREAVGAQATVACHVGDATTAADVGAAIERTEAISDRFGVCVAVVGGGGPPTPLLMITEHDLMEGYRRNIISALLAIQWSTPAMVRGGGGSIVCVSSSSAGRIIPMMGSYVSSKVAMEALVQTAADELGHLGIRVNAVRPGLTRTDSEAVARVFRDDERVSEYLAGVPLGRVGLPDDVAGAIRYLAGPESSWITGQLLAVEGGNLLRSTLAFEQIARRYWGDEPVDAAMAGQIPGAPQ
jgi:NAD(P)-dependent dehydrogenase (short-subunit alcohol dehydrogenase family)